MPLILFEPSFLQNQLLLALRELSVQKTESTRRTHGAASAPPQNSSTQLSGTHSISPTLALHPWNGPLFSPAMKLRSHLPRLIWANWHEQREP